MLYLVGFLATAAMSVFAVSSFSDADVSEDDQGEDGDWISEPEVEQNSESILQAAADAISDDLTNIAQLSVIGGGSGPDTLEGTEGDDVLLGREGDDELYGLDGSDTVFGGAGSDLAVTDAGNDMVYGEGGNDALHGRDGNDTLSGGEGSDSLFGGFGDDLVLGDAGQDFLSGGEGNDTLVAGGSDSLHGGNGQDLFVIEAVDGEEPADLMDFDSESDRVAFVVDDPASAEVCVVESMENQAISQIVVNGQIVATVPTDNAPDPADIVLWNKAQLASLV